MEDRFNECWGHEIELLKWEDMLDFIESQIRRMSLKEVQNDIFLYRGCLSFHQLKPSIDRSDERLIQYGAFGRGVKHYAVDGNVLDVFGRNFLFIEALCQFYKKSVLAGHEFPFVSENIHNALIRSDKNDFFHTHDLMADPSAYGILALAQHHGLPTPLLDWTMDPWIALYFSTIQALKEIVDNPSSIHKKVGMSLWIASEPFFNQTVLPEVVTKDGVNYMAKYPYRVRVINPARHHNSNLHAQRGKFTTVELIDDSVVDFHKYLNLPPMEDFWGEMVAAAKAPTFGSFKEHAPGLTKATIDIQESTKIFRYLQNSGYSAEKIFPSLAGSLKALEEMHLCMRAEKSLENV
jgi:hypothetical protein